MHVSVSEHFILRAQERLGYDKASAVELGNGLFWAIDSRRGDLALFVARVSRDGKRLFRFRATNGRCYYALLDTENRVCITVMPPGYTVGRQGKSYIRLKETDL
jgi:hypothetical protein